MVIEHSGQSELVMGEQWGFLERLIDWLVTLRKGPFCTVTIDAEECASRQITKDDTGSFMHYSMH